MKCLICLFGDEVRLYFIVFRPACSASRCERASFHRLKKAWRQLDMTCKWNKARPNWPKSTVSFTRHCGQSARHGGKLPRCRCQIRGLQSVWFVHRQAKVLSPIDAQFDGCKEDHWLSGRRPTIRLPRVSGFILAPVKHASGWTLSLIRECLVPWRDITKLGTQNQPFSVSWVFLSPVPFYRWIPSWLMGHLIVFCPPVSE